MLGLQVPLLTDADRMNDGFGTSGQPHDRLLTWPYQEKNTMFYDSSQQKAVALSDAERARQVQVCCIYSCMETTFPIPACNCAESIQVPCMRSQSMLLLLHVYLPSWIV